METTNIFKGKMKKDKRTLDIHAPRKQKYARGNDMPFVKKALSKETMIRTRP